MPIVGYANRAFTGILRRADAGLAAQRPYWYRFHAGGAVSETGCARTLPAPGAALDQLHIASVGCHDYESGFFTAFAHLAREPMLDAVFHYGDYIYEFGRRAKNPLRVHAGEATIFFPSDVHMPTLRVRASAVNVRKCVVKVPVSA